MMLLAWCGVAVVVVVCGETVVCGGGARRG